MDSADRIYEAEDMSQSARVLILKYSHRCVINYVMKYLLQKEWCEGEMKMKTFLLNVVDNREISDDISQRYNLQHESPQALILEKGRVKASFSHGKVVYSNLKQFAN